MKNRRSKRRIGIARCLTHSTKSSGFPAPPEAITGIVRRRATARGQVAIEAGLHAVGIHGSEQNFARAECLAAARPFHRIDPFIVRGRPWCIRSIAGARAAGIDGQHHGLRAELLAQFA